jgi:MoaA/NifB/PqqE/SkfB family radical SAM enzyme
LFATLVSRFVCGLVATAYDLLRQDFPNTVRVETTNACNACCVICPHHKMSRPAERMKEPLFRRIVDECAANDCREIHLHNFGEPLLDRQLEERIRYAKQAGLRRVKVFSNGSLITQTRARRLIEAGLDEIKISIDGASQEEFERIRYPLRFEHVIRNIHQLVAVRNERQSKLSIRVACCSTSDKTATMAALENVVDGFSFGKIHNWASEHEEPREGGLLWPCSRLWRTLTVLANGEVALCCLDYDGRHILGQIDGTTSIRDIWSSSTYRRLRRMHARAQQLEISLCGSCTKSLLWQTSLRTSKEPSPEAPPAVMYSIRGPAAQPAESGAGDRGKRRAA